MSNLDKTPRRIVASDIAVLREKLGVTAVDMDWIRGTKKRTFRLTGTGDQLSQVIVSPVDSMIYRYLDRFSEDYPLPAMPDVRDLLARTKAAWPEQRIPWRQGYFSLIIGCQDLTVRTWVSGTCNVSLPVSRLMYLLDQCLKLTNSTTNGLELYLALVEREAISRGFGSLYALLDQGNWGSSENSEHNPERLKESIIDVVKELCGLSSIDALWLMGYHQAPTKKHNQNKVIADPTTALFYRVLHSYPNLDFVPVMPTIGDPMVPDSSSVIGALLSSGIDDALKRLSGEGIKTPKGINGRKFGLLLGCSFMMGYSWTHPSYRTENMSNTTLRLAYLLVNAIKKRGVQGFLDYYEVLQDEVLSRGRDMDEFWNMGWPEWRGVKSVETLAPASESTA
ncbi:hypothetical protein RP726_05585 [Candidatus Methylospira mobilis]|uniref:hypothetical protein n=1 Tax=Candidatus Methylospira mobilis TaxID=1808979 RepID=UPI0028ED39EA|nr:hypothetical protein [Candidatus Methylospira mobilis]WNV05883.1 hypothetical protein RP726_05585 [Candidatus Methylospira mobilis]